MNTCRSKLLRFYAAAALWCFSAGLVRGEDSPAPSGGDAPRLRMSTDFAGGSGRELEIDQRARRVSIEPTRHDGRGWICWWYIRLSGIRPGETITLDVGDAPWATPDRAAFSLDNKRWQQTAAGVRAGKRIEFRQRVESSQAWFAWGPPFTHLDADALVRNSAAACDAAEAFELCRTREKRAVPALHISPPEVVEPVEVWVQARQHAWESGSSWVCRGLVEWLISGEPRAERLRKHARLTIVPVMDVDNVAIGAGGKNQVPHDHNRDWSDAPHWPAVAAAMERIRRMDQRRRLVLFLDLHNPGPTAMNPFFYITPRALLSEKSQLNLDRFLMSARQEISGPLAYKGETYESGPDYAERWQNIGKNWVTLHARDHVVAVTLETAWNTPHSTPDGYRTVGRQLGCAIERYLRTDPR